ncbi:MAG: radical SAM family heme chaperone HemW [Flavobacteriaceae bacterium]|nr:radical SAM family heme chaperone HemW [Flavobacteriaceae bacterium]
MSGIYIHIPFCKQACHYCDFHFSTSLKKKDELIASLVQEIELKKKRFPKKLDTIYFGGGTPSLLNTSEIDTLLNKIQQYSELKEGFEITLEANPDDLTETKIRELAATQINRLSIGVQSFFEEDLHLMNRAHKATEAKECLSLSTQYFDNITIDLIYGIPNMSNERWLENIQTALSFNISHISCYALTVEPKTALEKFIEKGTIQAPKDEVAETHFHIIVDELEQNGFIHYELSNFGKQDCFSKHNSSYWQGASYIGIGPSAHSYNRLERSWNVANNQQYIAAIQEGRIPETVELLSEKDRFNEYVMTGLRTIFGVDLDYIENRFNLKNQLLEEAQKFIDQGLLEVVSDGTSSKLRTTPKGKFLCDGLASDLFII